MHLLFSSFLNKAEKKRSCGRFSGGVLGLIFAGYVPLASQYSLFCGQLQTPSQSLLGKYVIFAIPTQSLSIICIHLIDPLNRSVTHFHLHLQYRHSATFANCKYEELSYPQKSENVRPHSSNSIENAAPLQSIKSRK